MGNRNKRVQAGVEEVIGVLAGREMLLRLKESLVTQNPFKKLFGPKGERIFMEEAVSYNDTILPLWEFQFESEIPEGGDLRQSGFINSRIMFPNELIGNFKLPRIVAMIVSRYFLSEFAVNDFVRKVPGLIEFGENIQYNYNQVFNYGQMTVPVLTMRIPYKIDLRRMRFEDGCTDLDASLNEELISELETYFVEITDDEGTVLIPKERLTPEEGA